MRTCRRLTVAAVSLCLLLSFFLFPIAPRALEYPAPTGMGSALLYNIETASVLLEVEGDKKMAPKDTTHLMVALVAYDELQDKMTQTVTLTEEMVKDADGYNLEAGDKISVRDLFAIMLLRGASDATRALAVLAAGDTATFLSKMNAYAAELEMSSTVYTQISPTANDKSTTTARDTALLASEFYCNSFLSDLSSSGTESVSINGKKLTVYSRCALDYRNGHYDFLRSDMKGMAVSNDSDTLVAFGKFEELSYLVVVFDAPAIVWNSVLNSYVVPENNVYNTTIQLLDFARSGFEFRLLFNDYDIIGTLPVRLSRQADTVTVVPAENVNCFLPRDDALDDHLSYHIVWDVEELTAPVKLAEKVGTLQVLLDNSVVTEVDLVTNYAVSKSLLSELTSFLSYILLHPITILIFLLLAAFLVLRLLSTARQVSAAKASGNVPKEEKESSPEPPSEPLRSIVSRHIQEKIKPRVNSRIKKSPAKQKKGGKEPSPQEKRKD